MAYKINNTGFFICLLAQLDSLAAHNRQGSYKTRERYYEAMKRFCVFLADQFRIQKLAHYQREALSCLPEIPPGHWEIHLHHQDRILCNPLLPQQNQQAPASSPL